LKKKRIFNALNRFSGFARSQLPQRETPNHSPRCQTEQHFGKKTGLLLNFLVTTNERAQFGQIFSEAPEGSSEKVKKLKVKNEKNEGDIDLVKKYCKIV
jgi:hypothetical protein